MSKPSPADVPEHAEDIEMADHGRRLGDTGASSGGEDEVLGDEFETGTDGQENTGDEDEVSSSLYSHVCRSRMALGDRNPRSPTSPRKLLNWRTSRRNIAQPQGTKTRYTFAFTREYTERPTQTKYRRQEQCKPGLFSVGRTPNRPRALLMRPIQE